MIPLKRRAPKKIYTRGTLKKSVRTFTRSLEAVTTGGVVTGRVLVGHVTSSARMYVERLKLCSFLNEQSFTDDSLTTEWERA